MASAATEGNICDASSISKTLNLPCTVSAANTFPARCVVAPTTTQPSTPKISVSTFSAVPAKTSNAWRWRKQFFGRGAGRERFQLDGIVRAQTR
jgi:hypothetical protein